MLGVSRLLALEFPQLARPKPNIRTNRQENVANISGDRDLEFEP